MTLNTLFLPLLGGFLFYQLFYGTKHLAPYQPPQTILFWSATVGLLALFFAREAVVLLLSLKTHREQFSIWCLANLALPVLLTLEIGFLLGLLKLTLDPPRTASTTATRSRALLKSIFQARILLASIGFVMGGTVLWTVAKMRAADAGDLPDWLIWAALPALLLWAGYQWAKFANIPLASAVIRITILGLALLIGVWLACNQWSRMVSHWQHLASPVSASSGSRGLATAFLACVLGPIAAGAFNFLYTKQTAEQRYMRGSWPTEIEKLLYSAARLGRLVMLTMRDRKVYVGTAVQISTNLRRNDGYLVLLPDRSGYREKDTLAVQFTTVYKGIYAQMTEAERKQFYKILRIDEISSAGYFEEQYFVMFPTAAAGAPPTEDKDIKIGNITIEAIEIAGKKTVDGTA